MIRVSVHNVTTHALAEASGQDWQSATLNALRQLGEPKSVGIASSEIVGTNCRRIQVGTYLRKAGATNLGYVYTVSTLA